VITHHLSANVKYPGAITLCGRIYNGEFSYDNIMWSLENDIDMNSTPDHKPCKICLEKQPIALLEKTDL